MKTENKQPKKIDEISEEDKLMLEALKRLRVNPDFIVWRDSVAKPLIDQLELELSSQEADTLPEPILRAKLKQVNSLKSLFYTWFELVN